MINQFDFKIKELENMKKYPKELYFIGNTQLLKRKKKNFIKKIKKIVLLSQASIFNREMNLRPYINGNNKSRSKQIRSSYQKRSSNVSK